MTSNGNLLTVKGLTKLFPVSTGLFGRVRSFIYAVETVDLSIAHGQSLALVGESGCGKTTTGKMMVKLIEPTSGKIWLNHGDSTVEVTSLPRNGLRAFRRRVQMIFQDPYESLNPRLTVFDTVAEPLVVQRIGSVIEREELVAAMLALVGLTPPSSFLFRFPHELSGGQRQRVAIARALILNPKFVVADEPTSMLDVSIRTGVMNLMLDLAERLEISYLYITHDLAVARYMSHTLAVMYLGRIVEMGDTEEILARPQHPYTRALLSAVPVPDPTVRRDPVGIKGGVTAPIDPPPYCRFYERCPLADRVCADNPHPPLEDKGGGRLVACYHV